MDAKLRLMDERSLWQEKQYQSDKQSTERALKVAADTLAAWQKHHNEFREQIREERVNFFPKLLGNVSIILSTIATIIAVFAAIGK